MYRSNHFSFHTIILAVSLICFSPFVFALPTDAGQPLHIEANSSSFNYKTGVNTYEGNVKIDQGSSHVLADRLVTKNNAQHKIQEAIAYGLTQLAEYTTTPKPGDPLFRAKAKVIKFYPQESRIVLADDVNVTQGENSFKGPVIIYNTKDQTVDAPASKGGRSTIIIEPDKLKS